MEKKLHRIPDQAVFGGVASGIAQYLQIDVVIVRVLFVVMLFLPIPPSFGWTGILYIILWAVLPTGTAEVHNFDTIANKPHDPEADKRRSDQTVKILGGALVLFGIFMLVDDFPIWYEIKPYFWPVALIIVGAFLILRQRDKEHEANTTVYPTTPPVEPIEPEPYTPTPDPQPYTPFGTTESTPPNTFPQDPKQSKRKRRRRYYKSELDLVEKNEVKIRSNTAAKLSTAAFNFPFSTFNYIAMNFKNIFWGIILIIMGTLFLVEELTGFDFRGFFWPIILIISGALLLLRNYINSDTNHSNI